MKNHTDHHRELRPPFSTPTPGPRFPPRDLSTACPWDAEIMSARLVRALGGHFFTCRPCPWPSTHHPCSCLRRKYHAGKRASESATEKQADQRVLARQAENRSTNQSPPRACAQPPVLALSPMCSPPACARCCCPRIPPEDCWDFSPFFSSRNLTLAHTTPRRQIRQMPAEIQLPRTKPRVGQDDAQRHSRRPRWLPPTRFNQAGLARLLPRRQRLARSPLHSEKNLRQLLKGEHGA